MVSIQRVNRVLLSLFLCSALLTTGQVTAQEVLPQGERRTTLETGPPLQVQKPAVGFFPGTELKPPPAISGWQDSESADTALRRNSDVLKAGLSWADYERERVSYGNLVWCWMIPGSCQYKVSGHGHTFNLVRGLVYTAAFVGGFGTMIAGAVESGDSSRDNSGSTLLWTGVGMMAGSFYISFIDGAFSIGPYNRDLMQAVRSAMPDSRQ